MQFYLASLMMILVQNQSIMLSRCIYYHHQATRHSIYTNELSEHFLSQPFVITLNLCHLLCTYYGDLMGFKDNFPSKAVLEFHLRQIQNVKNKNKNSSYQDMPGYVQRQFLCLFSLNLHRVEFFTGFISHRSKGRIREERGPASTP